MGQVPWPWGPWQSPTPQQRVEVGWGCGRAGGHQVLTAPWLHGLPARSRWFPQNLLPLTPHRDITEQDVLDTVMLSPTQPQLDPSSLNEGTVVSVPPRPDLRPST